MITNTQQAIYPLLLICSIFGINIYFPKKLYLNILYNLTVWISYGCLCCYMVTALKAGEWFQSVSNVVHLRIGVLRTITSIIMSIYRDKKFRLFMKKLDAVDDTLEELGTPKMYQKFHAYVKGVLIGWLVCGYTINICDMIWWFYVMEDRRCMILPYFINHFHHVNMLMDLLILIFLWYIGNRFDKVNEHGKYLIIKENYGLRNSWRRSVPITRQNIMCSDYKRILWTLMHLHLELCQIARELNTIFGPQMTIEMAAYLIYVARICNYIVMHVRTKTSYISTLRFWFSISFRISLYLTILFSLNCICERISVKANKMQKIIHQLTDSLQYTDIHDEMYQFSLQIMHYPLKFTGMGLFYFGYNLLRKFFTTITAFIIIIIQISDRTKDEKDF